MHAPDNVDPNVWVKMMRLLPTGVAEEMERLGEDELRDVIAQSENNVREQEELRRGDQELARAKMEVKDLGSGYRDAIKVQRAKQRLAAHLLAGRGKL